LFKIRHLDGNVSVAVYAFGQSMIDKVLKFMTMSLLISRHK